MVYSHCYMKESVLPLPEEVHKLVGYLAEFTPLLAPVLTRDQVLHSINRRGILLIVPRQAPVYE
jgi:hypothetical protein